MPFTFKALVTFLFQGLILYFHFLGLGNSETVLANPQIAQHRLEDGIAHRDTVYAIHRGLFRVLDNLAPYKSRNLVVALLHLYFSGVGFFGLDFA